MKEVSPNIFHVDRFVGGNDPWTTIRELRAESDRCRKNFTELLQIVVRLRLEQGGEMRIVNDPISVCAAIRIRPDPKDSKFILVQYLGDVHGEAEDNSNQKS